MVQSVLCKKKKAIYAIASLFSIMMYWNNPSLKYFWIWNFFFFWLSGLLSYFKKISLVQCKAVVIAFFIHKTVFSLSSRYNMELYKTSFNPQRFFYVCLLANSVDPGDLVPLSLIRAYTVCIAFHLNQFKSI
jgi:hypothetical protein